MDISIVLTRAGMSIRGLGQVDQLTWHHLSVKIYIDQSNMVKIQDKQMQMANCEYSLK